MISPACPPARPRAPLRHVTDVVTTVRLSDQRTANRLFLCLVVGMGNRCDFQTYINVHMVCGIAALSEFYGWEHEMLLNTLRIFFIFWWWCGDIIHQVTTQHSRACDRFGRVAAGMTDSGVIR